MKVTKKFLGSLGIILLAACSSGGDGGDGGDGGTPTPPPTPQPVAATLIFPDNNSTCIEGVIVSESNNRITFQWNEAQNTDSYTLVIRNLNTNQDINQSANTNQAAVTLDRGTPYQWYVISKAQGTNTTATSATWRFFNAGEGITNYTPFPADAVYPARGEQVPTAGTLNLEWAGADVDDDITGFEVYLDTEATLGAAPVATTESTLEVTISSGQTYYWKVVTFDSAGNSSNSEIFEFSVQ
jgi:hypothetical protein